MSNPYTSRGPLHDARLFHGRTHDLNEIGSYLSGNQSVSIVGPRKIGKTSLLLHLMRAETMAAFQIGEENLFVYIDCQALSSGRYDELIIHFCAEIASALRARDMEPEPALKDAVSKPTRSAFEGALRRLNQRGLRVVLMLDEFEQLTLNPQVDVNFYNALRSAAGRLRLVFLTASARPLIELTYSDRSQKILSSPFFNIFAQVFLGLLSETEARNLIRAPMEAGGIMVSAQLVEFIYELVGGHPLALQIACFHAWGGPDDLHRIERLTTQELDAHFHYYWHNLSPAERDALRQVPEADSRANNDPGLRVVFRSLIQKCLLVQARGSYRYPSKAWAEFVSAHLHDAATTPPAEPPAQSASGGTHKSKEHIGQDVQEEAAPPTGFETMGHVLRRVIRESLPEAIGGLTAQALGPALAAIVLGLAGLIKYFDVLVGAARSIDAHFGPAWPVLATLGTLVLGIAIIRIALRRKRGK